MSALPTQWRSRTFGHPGRWSNWWNLSPFRLGNRRAV